MGELMKYSAIATKIRAMESRLLKPEDYRHLAGMESVPQAVTYLKKIPTYAALLGSRDETQLHRGDIERLLVGTLYYDFLFFYRFCDRSQKSVLKLYFTKFEIAVLKRAFRRAFNHGDRTAEEREFREFIQHFTVISLSRLADAVTVEEILEVLKDTPYYRILKNLENAERLNLFDYEMTLDLYYFSLIWKQKDKLLKGKDRDLLTRSLGSKIDLLNMMWIYRAKKYYQLSEASTFALLIPINYRLHDSDIRAMVTAADEQELKEAIGRTYYGKRFLELDGEKLESIYDQVIRKIYGEEKRSNPYSMAVITGYIFEKEKELEKLITVLEGVRYGLPPEETLKYVEKPKDGSTEQRR